MSSRLVEGSLVGRRAHEHLSMQGRQRWRALLLPNIRGNPKEARLPCQRHIACGLLKSDVG